MHGARDGQGENRQHSAAARDAPRLVPLGAVDDAEAVCGPGSTASTHCGSGQTAGADCSNGVSTVDEIRAFVDELIAGGFAINVELTARCNSRCVYCSFSGPPVPRPRDRVCPSAGSEACRASRGRRGAERHRDPRRREPGRGPLAARQGRADRLRACRLPGGTTSRPAGGQGRPDQSACGVGAAARRARCLAPPASSVSSPGGERPGREPSAGGAAAARGRIARQGGAGATHPAGSLGDRADAFRQRLMGGA